MPLGVPVSIYRPFLSIEHKNYKTYFEIISHYGNKKKESSALRADIKHKFYIITNNNSYNTKKNQT